MSLSLSGTFDCPVCGLSNEDITFYAVGDCDHSICGICAVKLCLFSKRNNESDISNDTNYKMCVICKKDDVKHFITKSLKNFPVEVDKFICYSELGIIFESKCAESFYKDLVKNECKVCFSQYSSVDELVKHVGEHRLRYCELCLDYKKCLVKEQSVFNDSDYHYHRNAEHPKCQFCQERFYDNSHLINHVRQLHFLCDICKRREGPSAYRTQSDLFKHYRLDHFLCDICQSLDVINVYETSQELKVHQLTNHSIKFKMQEDFRLSYKGDMGKGSNRYRGRRNQAEVETENNEDIEEIQPQIVPEMDCETEFPRLDVPNTSNALGVASLSADDNDLRTAFTNSESDTTLDQNRTQENKQQCNKTGPIQTEHSMANSVANSVRLNIGKYNENDFPTLKEVSLKMEDKQKQQKQVSFAEKSAPSLALDNFPSLSNAPNNKNKVNNSMGKWGKKSEAKNKQRVLNSLSYNMEPQTKPMMTSNEVAGKHQSDDLISLKETNKTSSVSSNNWGSVTLSSSSSSFTSQEKSNKQVKEIQSQPILQSTEDFPALPNAKNPKTFTNWASGKQKKVKSPPVNTITQLAKEKVQSNTNRSKPSLSTTSEDVSFTAVSSVNSGTKVQKHPDSLKGISYIPNTAPPTKQSLSIVEDPSQFQSMKSSGATSSPNVLNNSEFRCKDYKNDFPAPLSNSSSNVQQYQSNTTKTVDLDDINDFPNLADTRSSSHKKQQHQQQSKKKTGKQAKKGSIKNKQLQENGRNDDAEIKLERAPMISKAKGGVCSLEAAASKHLPKRQYITVPKATERNETLAIQLESTLGDQCNSVLQAANQFRNGSINADDFMEKLGECGEILGDQGVLAEMTVLLPDINRQGELLKALQKNGWAKLLRECMWCGQVLQADGEDLKHHAANAHSSISTISTDDINGGSLQ